MARAHGAPPDHRVLTRPSLIVGARGQDGSLLAERLLRDGEPVVGIVRPGTATVSAGFPLHALDVTDAAALEALVAQVQPKRLFYLAAVHHSADGGPGDRHALWSAMTAVNCLGAVNAVRAILRTAPDCRLVFAASSQMYTPHGADLRVDETTPRAPRTFYGHTKAWSQDAIAFARTHDGLHGATAILFNHESPRRPPSFVTRKITRAAAAIHLGLETALRLADLGGRADWCSAEDVVDALLRMADAPSPGDYVIGSGTIHSVSQLLDCAFGRVGLEWRRHVAADRETTTPVVQADPGRIRAALGWQPTRSFEALIHAMVDNDLALLRAGR